MGDRTKAHGVGNFNFEVPPACDSDELCETTFDAPLRGRTSKLCGGFPLEVEALSIQRRLQLISLPVIG
jgi:hypothetical protein